MSSMMETRAVVFRTTPRIAFAWMVLAVLLFFVFREGLQWLVKIWDGKAEYSYGYLVPFVTLFLIYQKRYVLQSIPFTGSWVGVVILAFGVLLFALGELSTLYVIVQYALLIVLAGLVLAFTGWSGFRVISIPLLILAFMIPLPDFLLNNFSAKLQLLSSEIGVAVIRAFGISVNLEGNVIDLGPMKLQVVEACSGLRYLFPLMTFGFITAYFFRTAWWKRAAIFLSTLPITILMNSLRIGVIGVTVEYWGQAMAEGFLHDFEGWLVFMACTAVLFGEMWLLTRFGADRRPLRTVFGVDFSARASTETPVRDREFPRPFLVAAALFAAVAAAAALLPERVEHVPAREDFSRFPLSFGEWQGRGGRLEQMYVDTLKFDDYLLADYTDARNRPVNFYVAYYGSQRKGESAHSPRTCLPGGGWEITSLEQRTLDDVAVDGAPLDVNRVVIQLHENRQLVYYWFQQRGRVITNEYLVKWYLLWDSIARNRSDGALVRIATTVRPDQDLAQADRLLADFARQAVPKLNGYIPGRM